MEKQLLKRKKYMKPRCGYHKMLTASNILAASGITGGTVDPGYGGEIGEDGNAKETDGLDWEMDFN